MEGYSTPEFQRRCGPPPPTAAVAPAPGWGGHGGGVGRGVHLLLGFWWPLMVSYPPADMSAAVCWAEDAQGPPGVGLVPPVPMRGLALALGGPESGRCKGMRACRNERGGTRVENLPVKGFTK